MILSLKNGIWMEEDSLFEALDLRLDHQEILSLTGGGGKTTVIRRLQKECMERQLFHGVSTTTHMQYEQNESFLGSPSLESFLEIYRKTGTVWMGEAVSEAKMKGFPAEFYRQLIQRGAWLLLEADGAKCLPVKVPKKQEPVILPETTIVCNVYGLDGLGKSLKDGCFRSYLAAAILGKQETDQIKEQDLVLLASSLQGGRKMVGTRKYHVILNKADTRQKVESAKRMGEQLAEKGVCQVHITSHLLG